MDLQNLAYALTQVAHNFGAVAVVAVPLYALCSMHPAGSRGLLWLALSGWALQLASGAVFGAVSWHFYGQFPDIHGIAIGVLVLKVLCALVALVLIALSLYARPLHDGRRSTVTWRLLATLGGTALTGAAFLRWFS